MVMIRSVQGPARFSRRITQWGLTLLAVVAMFLSASAAYNLMVGQYAVSPAARRPAHPVLVNGLQMPTPAERHSDEPNPQAG
jgi:hypothetical protein